MSLFRTERLSVALCPEAVALRISGRGGRTTNADSRLLETTVESGTPPWKNAVAALAEGLSQLPRRLPARLILSNRFTRFALLPWSDAASGEAERQALALACLESHYGDMHGWTVHVDAGEFGVPCLACAVETELLETLRGSFTAHRVECHRVEPYFVACWNRWCRDVGPRDALFAVQEGGLAVASLRGGRWHSLRVLGSCADSDELTQAMAREALLRGFAETPTAWVHAPDGSEAGRPNQDGALRRLALPPEDAADAPRHVAWTMARLGARA